MVGSRVLLCEDDTSVRSVLERTFRAEGYTVVPTATGAEALRAAESQSPDLVLLDLGLPDSDGRDVCLALRSRGVDAPVLMLTALDATHHKVSGFGAGADDYLTKPFDVPELLARVDALLRRTTRQRGAGDGLTLDPVAHEAQVTGRTVALSPTEYRILARLVGASGQAVRRRELVAAAWPMGAQVSENTLDSYLRRLRSKLSQLDAEERVETVRGVGYRWR